MLALALTTALACSDSDVVTNSYATYGEAVRAGAVDQGWLPGGLPPGTFEIREAHDPGGRRRWGLFSFTEKDASALAGLLGPDVLVGGERCDPPARIEWWPLLLRGALEDSRLAATGLKVYRPANQGLTFAVNWNQRRAYYWSPE